jgi:hypothetical protein
VRGVSEYDRRVGGNERRVLWDDEFLQMSRDVIDSSFVVVCLF